MTPSGGNCQDDPNGGGFIDGNGQPSTCQSLRSVCTGQDYSETVQTACPVTCGICQVGDWRPCYPHTCAGGAPWPKSNDGSGRSYINYHFCSNIGESTRNVVE